MADYIPIVFGVKDEQILHEIASIPNAYTGLNLAGKLLDLEETNKLCSMLRIIPLHIINIDLSCNNLSSKGFADLMKIAMSIPTHMQYIQFRFNAMGNFTLKEFMIFMQKLSQNRAGIDMSFNNLALPERDTENLLRFLSMDGVVKLDLRMNQGLNHLSDHYTLSMLNKPTKSVGPDLHLAEAQRQLTLYPVSREYERLSKLDLSGTKAHGFFDAVEDQEEEQSTATSLLLQVKSSIWNIFRKDREKNNLLSSDALSLEPRRP